MSELDIAIALLFTPLNLMIAFSAVHFKAWAGIIFGSIGSGIGIGQIYLWVNL